MAAGQVESVPESIQEIMEDVMMRSELRKQTVLEGTANLDTDSLLNPIKNHAFNMYDNIIEEGNQLVDGMTLIEPMQLYNILMQHDRYPYVTDPNYLLLIDARRRETYDDSHILLAKFAIKSRTGDYNIPYGAEVETKRHIVVYDSLTDRIKFDDKKIKTDALKLAKLLYSSGSRNPIKILRGGFMLFSKLYPFLRTSQIVYLPMELDNFYTYPISVLSQKLYLGNWAQANDAKIQRDLKLTGFINCCLQEKGEPNKDQLEKGREEIRLYGGLAPVLLDASVLHLPGSDDDRNTLCTTTSLQQAISYIGENGAVLVFSRRGISRAAAICVGYVMYSTKSTLKKALKYCKECNINAIPNQKFIDDLSIFEEEIFGRKITTLDF